MDSLNLVEVEAYVQSYWMAYIPWAVIVGFLVYTVVKGKQVKPKDTKRNWFSGITQLGVAKKLRGFTMGKKAARSREKFVREYISMHWLLSVEQAWAAGLITNAERDKYVDELAFKFSDKSLFVNGRMGIVKAKVRKSLKELKKQKPIPFPDLVPPTNTKKGEGETGLKIALTKAA